MTKKTINEISKSLAARYVVKAAADRAKQTDARNDAESKRFYTKMPHQLVKDYGETDDDFNQRKKNVVKRRNGLIAARDVADRKMNNRNSGLYKAGRILAREDAERLTKEESDMNEDMKEFSNASGKTSPLKPVDALGKGAKDGLGKEFILTIAEGNVAGLERMVDEALRARIDEVLFGSGDDSVEE